MGPPLSFVILQLPPSISLAVPCRPFWRSPFPPHLTTTRGPSHFGPLFSVGLNSCGRSSRAFVSLSLRSLTVSGLLPMRAAARGERRVRDMKAQERRQHGLTADGELRTESRAGPCTAEGRGVDWVREKGMNRS
jgi:hypothetical protein